MTDSRNLGWVTVRIIARTADEATEKAENAALKIGACYDELSTFEEVSGSGVWIAEGHLIGEPA